MTTPSLLLTTTEQRNANGPVTVTPSASVEVRDGAWWLARGTDGAALLLSPDGSHDANGPVEPTILGDVSVVAGQCGQAWDISGGPVVLGPYQGHVNPVEGMALLRLTVPNATPSEHQYLLDIGAGASTLIQAYQASGTTNMVYFTREDGTNTALLSPGSFTAGVPMVLAFGWEDDRITARVNTGSEVSAVRTVGRTAFANPNFRLMATSGVLESAAIYPAFDASERDRLMALDRAWTWGDGTIATSLATSPATLLLRTRDGETVTTHEVALTDGAGEAGGAKIAHDGTTLTIGTDDEVEVVGVLAFDEALSESEIERYSRMVWVWESLLLPEPTPPLSPQPPLILLTPAEQRNADGPVSVTPSDSVEVRDGAWWLARGIGDASLLISPDGSYNAGGPVETDTINGPVPVVAGDYGGAWALRSDETGNVRFPVGDIGGSGAGTILIRFRPAPLDDSFNPHVLYGSGFNLYRNWADTRYNWSFGGLTLGEVIASGIGAMSTIAARWEGDQKSLMRNGDVIASGELTPPVALPSPMTLGASSYYSPHGDVEGVLIYDTALPNAEITRLSQMDRAWTWGPDGTITVPLATTPATLLIRTRSGSTVTTHHVELTIGEGEAGGATVTHDGTTLTIGTDDEVEVVGVLAFGEALSPFDIARYSNPAMVWTWDHFMPPEPVPSLPPQPPQPIEMQDYIDASDKAPVWFVFINGILTKCTEVNVRHGVREPIGSCQITLPLPLPSHIALGAEIEVQAGYDDHVATIFKGSIPNWKKAISMSGNTAELKGVSSGDALSRRDYTDVEYKGPISLKALFQAMNRRRGVKSFYSDETTYPIGGTEIRLGNNRDANDRMVVVPRKTSSLHFLNDAANLFGYYVFDTPIGMRQQRVSGRPNEAAAITVREAWNAIDLSLEEDISTIVNYWEVFGASYTDADGVEQRIRSIPQYIPEEYGRDEVESELLDTIQLADAVRNVHEIDHGAPYSEVRWTTHGAPHIMPGNTVNVISDMLGISGLQWIMSVEHTLNMDGFLTTCSGWRGSGSLLPAGEDCVITTIESGIIRLGDEHVPWYAIPNPTGKKRVIPFTVQAEYSSIAVYGYAHGTNSQIIGNENTDLEISKFEIWQNGEEVGSGNLPVLAENYNRRLPYGSGLTHWSRIVIPISGSLEPGRAELHIIAGENPDLPASTKFDDFELQGLYIRTCGVGQPTIGVPR